MDLGLCRASAEPRRRPTSSPAGAEPARRCPRLPRLRCLDDGIVVLRGSRVFTPSLTLQRAGTSTWRMCPFSWRPRPELR